MRLLFLLLLLVLLAATVQAQSGWSENQYYDARGESGVVCGSTYPVFAGYGAWNQPVYAYYQNCQRRDWYSWYGTTSGYRWTWTGYEYTWQSYYDTRTWWYFTWYNFSRRVG